MRVITVSLVVLALAGCSDSDGGASPVGPSGSDAGSVNLFDGNGPFILFHAEGEELHRVQFFIEMLTGSVCPARGTSGERGDARNEIQIDVRLLLPGSYPPVAQDIVVESNSACSQFDLNSSSCLGPDVGWGTQVVRRRFLTTRTAHGGLSWPGRLDRLGFQGGPAARIIELWPSPADRQFFVAPGLAAVPATVNPGLSRFGPLGEWYVTDQLGVEITPHSPPAPASCVRVLTARPDR